MNELTKAQYHPGTERKTWIRTKSMFKDDARVSTIPNGKIKVITSYDISTYKEEMVNFIFQDINDEMIATAIQNHISPKDYIWAIFSERSKI